MCRYIKAAVLFLLVFLPLIALAQQTSGTATVGKSLTTNDSLATVTSKPAADSTPPALANPGNYWFDPIGDEEEMDAMGGYDYDYQEWLLMWPEQNEGRDFDPLDPREDAQAADTRE